MIEIGILGRWQNFFHESSLIIMAIAAQYDRVERECCVILTEYRCNDILFVGNAATST